MRTSPFSSRLVVLAAVFLAGAGPVGAGQALQCVAVDGDLFEPAADEVAQAVREVLDAGGDVRLAGSGRTLGILLNRFVPGELTLLLVRRGRIAREMDLQVPAGAVLPERPMFFLGAGGDVAALTGRDVIVVFRDGDAAGVITGLSGPSVALTAESVFWTTTALTVFPDPAEKGGPGGDATLDGWLEEPPPLLEGAELDGSRRRTLLAHDLERARADGGFPYLQSARVVARPDGRLWLVRRFAPEAILLDDTGRVRERLELAGLRRPEDDPVLRAELELDRDRELERTTERIRARGRDATKPPPRLEKVVAGPVVSVLFAAAHARDDELVLVTAQTDEPPPGTLLGVSGDGDTRCWRLPRRLVESRHPAVQIAVTEEAVWFREPLGAIPWEVLDRLWAEAQEPGREDSQE